MKNIIESLVNPDERKNAKIQDLSFFAEIKNEHKKVKRPARLKQDKKRMSRKEFKELGLYSLPRKTLKYTDYVKLNNLWNGYMEQQFDNDLEALKLKFDPSHPLYEQTSSIIHKSDFHGAKVKVTQSKCVSLVGHKGIILIDSKGTFSIISKDNVVRVIPKNDSIFEFKWKTVSFTVYGRHLCYRSADRSTKKIKNVPLIPFAINCNLSKNILAEQKIAQ